EPIYDSLRKVVLANDRILDEVDGYYSVGDFCNRLFVVYPFKNIPDSARRILAEEIYPTVQTINGQIVTASESQLSKIENIIIIAGGSDKAPAIATVLLKMEKFHGIHQKFPKISALCTDDRTAQRLLDLATVIS